MKLKIFFDSEYFSFARDYISLYNFENVLFFDPTNSTTFKNKSLKQLTDKFIDTQAENPDLDGNTLKQQFVSDQIAIFKDI